MNTPIKDDVKETRELTLVGLAPRKLKQLLVLEADKMSYLHACKVDLNAYTSKLDHIQSNHYTNKYVVIDALHYDHQHSAGKDSFHFNPFPCDASPSRYTDMNSFNSLSDSYRCTNANSFKALFNPFHYCNERTSGVSFLDDKNTLEQNVIAYLSKKSPDEIKSIVEKANPGITTRPKSIVNANELKDIVQELNPSYTATTKQFLKFWEPYHQWITKLKQILRRKIFHADSKVAQALIGACAICAPQASIDKIELIISTVTAYYLHTLAFPWIEKSKIPEIAASISPSRYAISEGLSIVATNQMMMTRSEVMRVKEKGGSCFTSSDKSSGGHYILTISHFDPQACEVVYRTIGMERCSGYSDDAAKSTKKSLERLCIENLKSDGQSTDAGGGGTGISLYEAMKKLDLTNPKYLYGFCGSHGIHLPFANACTKIIGVGGLENKNAVQLLHTCYTIQHLLKGNFNDLFRLASEKARVRILNEAERIVDHVPKMQEPISTRWATTGLAAMQVMPNILIWVELSKMCIKGTTSTENSALHKASTNLLGLIKDAAIRSDVKLLAGFHKYFLKGHHEFMECTDQRFKGKPGFLSRLMLHRFALMIFDLQDIRNGGWRNKSEFACFVSSLDETDMSDEAPELLGERAPLDSFRLPNITKKQAELQAEKIEEFIKTALNQLCNQSHFKPWCTHLLFFSLFGEGRPAQMIAQYVLGMDMVCQEDEMYVCAHQRGRELSLKRFAKFIKDHVPNDENCTEVFEQVDRQHVEFIARGGSIWDSDTEEAKYLRDLYLNKYSAFPASCQFVESTVKQANYCDNDFRNGLKILAYAQGADMIRIAQAMAVDEKKASGYNYKDPNNIDARGSSRCKFFISLIETSSQQAEAMKKETPENREVYDAMKALISREKEHGFETEMSMLSRERFNQLSNNRAAIAIPKSVVDTVADETSFTKGHVDFKQLSKGSHFDLLIFECEKREIIFNDTTNFSALKSLLIQQNGGRVAQSFKPVFKSVSEWNAATQDEKLKKATNVAAVKKTQKYLEHLSSNEN